MCLRVLVLPVFIVCYGIAKCVKEIIRGSVMCHYLMANDLGKKSWETLTQSLLRGISKYVGNF